MRTHVIYTKRKFLVASTKNSSNPQLVLAELIGRAARRWHQLAEQSFAALRINHTEARLLTLLRREGGSATQDVLSNQLSVDRSNAGRALSRLENAGLVARRQGESDGRTKSVEITEAGDAVVEQIASLQAEMAQELLGRLTKAQVRAASDVLTAVLDDEA